MTTLSAFGFPHQPGVLCLCGGREAPVVKTLLASSYPISGWHKALVRCNYQCLSFQGLFLMCLCILAVVEVAAICANKLGWVVYDVRTLGFIELIHIQVGHKIGRILQHLANLRPIPILSAPCEDPRPLHRTATRCLHLPSFLTVLYIEEKARHKAKPLLSYF